MNILPIVEYALSLIFIALIFSLFVSWVIDYYASQVNRKGRFLKEMLTKMLGHGGSINWAARLYRHPLIEGLSIKHNRITSYIPSKLFAEVMTDLIVEEGEDYNFSQDKDGKIKYNDVPDDKETGSDLFSKLGKGLEKIPESDIKRTLKLYYENAKGVKEDSITHFMTNLQAWYDEYMVRVNYSYKRKIKKPLFILGVITALIFNIDFIKISTELWTNTHLRKEVVELAIEFENKYDSLEMLQTSKDFFINYQSSLKLPMGWKNEIRNDYLKKISGLNDEKRIRALKEFEDQSENAWSIFKNVLQYLFTGKNAFWNFLLKLIGFLVSGLVVSFGAPFWFQALQKVVDIRKTVQQSSKS